MMPFKSIKNAAADAQKLKTVQTTGNLSKAQEKAGRPKKANGPARIKRLRDRPMLAASLGGISAQASNEKSAWSSPAVAVLID